jgi:hypothetical protein
MAEDVLLSQDQIDELMQLSEFISSKKGATRQLIREMRSAILDSGKLSLGEWRGLRNSLREIEELLPVIEMIIKLKEQENNRDA